MNRYSATVEIISSTRAIVTMFDAHGEWAGAGRVEVKFGSRSALYEEGYLVASMNAASKGGMLDRYTEVK